MSSRAWGLIKDLASKFTIKIIQGEYDIKQVASSQRSQILVLGCFNKSWSVIKQTNPARLIQIAGFFVSTEVADIAKKSTGVLHNSFVA